tara:strand:+ start:14742 stop:15803 length:1062 start_codon:yes stop_codon:yes gene_type:complete
MTNKNQGSVLIIGDGLAGTLMAWKCHQRGVKFVQWSDGSPAASDVAAGMFNPVSFRRILPQWDAANYAETAREMFQAIQQELECKLRHDVPVIRVFPNERYAALWAERIAEEGEVAQFIEILPRTELHPSLDAPFGAGIVRSAGWVDVRMLTQKSRLLWQRLGLWERRSWAMEDGCPVGFSTVIDCRGVGVADDLAKFGLEVSRNHGEVLTIQTELDWGEQTVNNVTWALPIGSGEYRIGSTYRWDMDEPLVRPETIENLTEQVSTVRKGAALVATDVVSHRAGLRPACFDRRPILGRISSKSPWYFVCTGWGTRGVSIGPTMVDWTLDVVSGIRDEVPDEVHPKRFRTFTKN